MDKYYVIAKINSEMKEMKLEQDNTKLESTKKSKIIKIPDPSPKTIRRNKSRDNFLKYQWSWTI